MKKTLKWRLSKLPTPDEVRELVKDKILTQDEAREILFDLQTEEDRDVEGLKAEIKFLRELVDRLSKGRADTTTVIREYIPRYNKWTWVDPYVTYCNSFTTTSSLALSGGVGLDDKTANYTTSATKLSDLAI